MDIVKNSNEIFTLTICKTIQMLYITVTVLGKLATYRCIYITSTICQLTGISLITYEFCLTNNNEISTLIYLQNNTDVISRYSCNGNTHVHNVDPVYVRKFTCLFIDRI